MFCCAAPRDEHVLAVDGWEAEVKRQSPSADAELQEQAAGYATRVEQAGLPLAPLQRQAPPPPLHLHTDSEWTEKIRAEDVAAYGADEQSVERSAAASACRGVTIGFLVAFTIQHKCWEWPTWQVVKDIIKPLTADRRCRFVDLPSVRAAADVGPAATFTSHCWGAQWGLLISAVADSTARSRRVWIDVLAVRQWPGSVADLCFDGVVARCSSFVLVCGRIRVEYPTGERFPVPAGLSKEELFAGRSDLLEAETRSKIAFFRSWCARATLHQHGSRLGH